ncbi:MAG: hypothetical protein ABGW87_07615 [Sphingomonadaceae bacterium]
MLELMLSKVGDHDATQARWGLPVGAVHLPDRNLIVAGTPCDAPLFQQAMVSAAKSSGSDVVMMHHGFCPETLDPVEFSVLVHIDEYPNLFEHLLLYSDLDGNFWLIPSLVGPSIALESDGLRVSSEPPFMTWHQRSDGLCRAAKEVVKASRWQEAA